MNNVLQWNYRILFKPRRLILSALVDAQAALVNLYTKQESTAFLRSETKLVKRCAVLAVVQKQKIVHEHIGFYFVFSNQTPFQLNQQKIVLITRSYKG